MPSVKFSQVEVALKILQIVPSMMFFLYLTGASALNWRIRPVSVGFWYHEVSIFPFNKRTSMSRKGIALSLGVSMVNSKFGCRLLLTSRMRSMLDTLALLSMSSTYRPKTFASGVSMGVESFNWHPHGQFVCDGKLFISANVKPAHFLWNQDLQVEHWIAWLFLATIFSHPPHRYPKFFWRGRLGG